MNNVILYLLTVNVILSIYILLDLYLKRDIFLLPMVEFPDQDGGEK